MAPLRYLAAVAAVVALGLVGTAHAASRGIEVAVKEAGGSVETVRLYSRAYAVIIGIDRYENLPPGSELSYAVRDAQGVAEVLERDYAFDGIVTIYNEDATKEGILRLLSAELGATSEDDSVFIFWAGHALTKKTAGRGDIGYLVPYDGTFDESELTFRNISMTTIREDISRSIPAKHVFCVVDACYSGLLVTRALEPGAPTRSLAYLRDITGEEVRQVLAAGKAGQTVLDGGPRGHSVFTGRFIEALENATDYITATEISTRISEQVFSDAAARGHAQTPQGGKLFGPGDYVFVPKRAAVASAAQPSRPASSESGLPVDMQVWDRIEDSTDAAVFDTFIESFPSSPMVPFADQARATGNRAGRAAQARDTGGGAGGRRVPRDLQGMPRMPRDGGDPARRVRDGLSRGREGSGQQRRPAAHGANRAALRARQDRGYVRRVGRVRGRRGL